MSNPTVMDIADAPRDGTVIEVLFDGDWYEAYWSSRADDMSSYGVEGWAEYESRMLIVDIEGWRDGSQEKSVDEYEESVQRQREHDERIAEEKRAARKPRRKTSEVRKELEQRYLELTGEDISGQRISHPKMRARINLELTLRSRASISEAFKLFGL